jgi:hypothetical protein
LRLAKRLATKDRKMAQKEVLKPLLVSLFLFDGPFDLSQAFGHRDTFGADFAAPPHRFAPPCTLFTIQLRQPAAGCQFISNSTAELAIGYDEGNQLKLIKKTGFPAVTLSPRACRESLPVRSAV